MAEGSSATSIPYMVFFLLDTQVRCAQNPRRFFDGATDACGPWGNRGAGRFDFEIGGESNGVFARPHGTVRKPGVRSARALAARRSGVCGAMFELRFTAAKRASAIDTAPAHAAETAIELPAAGALRDFRGKFGCGERPRSRRYEKLCHMNLWKAPRNRGLTCFGCRPGRYREF